MTFKKVDVKQSFPKMEEEILKYWDENKIFEKSVNKNPEEKTFVFYEGPPTANGKPGLHHVLARAFKDIIPRYKTMKGYRVERKAGWDTHGLPVELQVEKALGLRNKQDIENIVPGDARASIIEFNKKCKESVWEYKDLWEKLTKRMAYWVDLENPYITYDNKFIESVWWVIAQIAETKNEKGESLIYKGHKVVPYCYRCGTTLSSHEVAQGYQTVKDNSAYIKFQLKSGQKIGNFTTNDETFVLAWTTTPWTLPGNVALAINADIKYSLLKVGEEKYLVATEALDNLLSKSFFTAGEYEVEEELLGEYLLGLEYQALYETNDTKKKSHYIISGDFVTTQDGTGVVHIAPAFGEDDARVGKENDLPTLLTVSEDGKVSAEVPGKGILVKKKNEKNRYAVDDLIIEDLKERGLFFKEEEYEHEYPHCWRCDTPLVYYAKPSWFIRMNEFSEELSKNNENINWVPEHIKEGRFGEWLRGVKDWAISRERYWGTPLPIWQCDSCDQIKVISSIAEIEQLSGMKIEDVHKPYIDDVSFGCSCGGKMVRTPEVLDVWFDSGSMPLAQWYYPNAASEENSKKIETGKLFPADYISEAIDQTRGWFYTLHAIATLLNKAGKVSTGYAYKNVICLGHILDAKGKKMSKSRGNMVNPDEVMNEYGADMLRWMLYTINQPGLPKKFDIKGMKDIMNRVFRMLWNSYSFFVMYANIDDWKPKNEKVVSENILDQWILTELNLLIKSVDEKLAAYDIYGAAAQIEKFVDNLSNWYIRRSRKRFWKSEDDNDKELAYQTLHTVLINLAKLMAPFTPFIAEEIYTNLTGEESVHLADFPTYDEEKAKSNHGIDLVEKMAKIREIISSGLQLRAQAKIKVRQPLQTVKVKLDNLQEELAEIIMEELNIKNVEADKNFPEDVQLDTNVTQELRLEGYAREIIRFIQEMRKEAGYEVENRIAFAYIGMDDVFAQFSELISKEVLADKVSVGELENSDLRKQLKVDDLDIILSVKR